jgi:predicted class III extradiol MEMO1 family dioxygenase
MVGSLKSESAREFGSLLAKYMDDPCNFFVISSDFCHWGKRFSYYYYDESYGPIYKSIEALDRM